jgi:hypothetical protein
MLMSLRDRVPEFLLPTLKLFLSVDLVGSTKLKHDEDVLHPPISQEPPSLDSVGAKWFNALIDFYGGFEEKFSDEWSQAFQPEGVAEAHWPRERAPTLWKVNGDELIYVLDIEHPGQIVVALCAWRRALLRYRGHLHERLTGLDVKATAWLAGFPIANHEVAFWRDLSKAAPNSPEHAGKFGQYYRLNEWHQANKKGEPSDYVRDYIGPAVDTGFRISSFASPRKFPVSIEIAYFLSNMSFDAKLAKEIGLRFHGRESLKGVLGGIPYPIFWIDCASPDDRLTQAEDKLSPLPKICDIVEVREYADLFFDDPKNKLFRPFILDCPVAAVGKLPDNYEPMIVRTANIWELEQQKAQIQLQSYEISSNDVVAPVLDSNDTSDNETESQIESFETMIDSILAPLLNNSDSAS